MPVTLMKSRLHHAVATQADLDCEGSVADLGVAPVRWPSIGYRGVRERTVKSYARQYHIDETDRIVTVRRIFGPYQNRTDP